MTAGIDSKTPKPGTADTIEIALEKEMRDLIARYGREQTKDAALRLTRAKRGPKPRKDWHLLWPVIADDAQQLLDGRDPFFAKTNYAIAFEFAAEEPGHNRSATVERIERKLRKYRKPLALENAATIAEKISSHPDYLRMLAEWEQAGSDLTFNARILRAQETLATFEARYGLAPPQFLSISKISTVNAFQFGPLSGFHASSSEQKMQMALHRLAEKGQPSHGAAATYRTD